MIQRLTCLMVFLGLLVTAPRAAACKIPFPSDPVTFRKEATTAHFVLVVKVVDSRFGENDFTDLAVLNVLKSHAGIAGKMKLRLPRFFAMKESEFLVFGEVVKGELDLYRGTQSTPELLQYFRGLLDIDPTDGVALAQFCFAFLESGNPEIAADAFVVLKQRSDDEMRKLVKDLSRDSLRKMLKKNDPSPGKRPLLAYLLGCAGDPADAPFLRALLNDPEKRSGSDGVLKGLILLDPKGGWEHLCSLLQKSETSFIERYAALLACRYFVENRPGWIDKTAQARAMKLALDREDMADFALEDLRRWARWELTDHVLNLAGKKSHDTKLIRRCLLRYALDCPEARAADFVTRQRQRDPKGVEEVERMLRREK